MFSRSGVNRPHAESSDFVLDAEKQGPVGHLGNLRARKIAGTLLKLHGYWKSKAFEVHSQWREVTESVNVSSLDKNKVNVDKLFEEGDADCFKLGDAVKIVAKTARTFKALHVRAGLWRRGLSEHIGKCGIVMEKNVSGYGVMLEDGGTTVIFHAFAMIKLEKFPDTGIWRNETEYKRGDSVRISVEREVLQNLQKQSTKTTPREAIQFIGCTARVLCAYKDEIAVTFNERQYECFHPGALELTDAVMDDENEELWEIFLPPYLRQNFYGQNIQIGTEIVVSNNLLEVMELQRERGGWNHKMTEFIGKEGKVVDKVSRKEFIVRFSPYESYQMSKAVLYNKDSRRRSYMGAFSVDSSLFKVGDIVRFKMDNADLLCNIQLLRIPLKFMPMLTSGMVFAGYTSEMRGLVDVGDGILLVVNTYDIMKADSVESKRVKEMIEKDKEIRAGSKVILNVGPKAFVEKCLEETELKAGFLKALKKEATVVGFDDHSNAIIKFQNGSARYSIPEEYLCTPRETWNEAETTRSTSQTSSLGPAKFSALDIEIINSITEVLKRNGEKSALLHWECSVKLSDIYENCTNIDVTFPESLGDYKKFLEVLQSKLGCMELPAFISDDKININAPGWQYIMAFSFKAATDIGTSRKRKRPVKRHPPGKKKAPSPKPQTADAHAQDTQKITVTESAEAQATANPQMPAPGCRREPSPELQRVSAADQTVTTPPQREIVPTQRATTVPQNGENPFVVRIPSDVSQITFQLVPSQTTPQGDSQETPIIHPAPNTLTQSPSYIINNPNSVVIQPQEQTNNNAFTVERISAQMAQSGQ